MTIPRNVAISSRIWRATALAVVADEDLAEGLAHPRSTRDPLNAAGVRCS